MQGESKFKTSFKDRVLADVVINYDYSITDAKKFIGEAKYIGKAGSDAQDESNSSTAYEGAENTVIDKRIEASASYNVVAAVPPYKDSMDCTHIKHMYDFLVPGGKLISYTLPIWATGGFTIHRDFRGWLHQKDFRIEFLEDESYVNCPKALLIITKQ